MAFGRKEVMEEIKVDPTGWMLQNSLAEFVLMHTAEIQYMCMFGYTFLHGHKLFSNIPMDASTGYKFVSFLLACTGGGILVPIFVNGIPVPLANDAYPMMILFSFALHQWFPIMRDVVAKSNIFKVTFVVLYETLRASVVVKLTTAAATKIAPSLFSFPLFGPIFCGTLAGCGGAFLPFNKGLEPIKGGLLPPMLTAHIGATCFHLYVHTSLSEGCVDAKKKAHLYLALFFITSGIVSALGLSAKEEKTGKTKKE